MDFESKKDGAVPSAGTIYAARLAFQKAGNRLRRISPICIRALLSLPASGSGTYKGLRRAGLANLRYLIYATLM